MSKITSKFTDNSDNESDISTFIPENDKEFY